MSKKKIIISVAVVMVILIIVSTVRGGRKVPEYTTVNSEYGEVKQTVDATGAIKSSEAIDLNFRATGRIVSIPVKVGDEVIAGQLLASLDTSALSSQVSDARSALLEAKANLEKTLSGSTQEDIRISEIAVNQKETELLAAKANLENLKSKRDTELANYKKTLVVTLHNELFDAEAALETIKTTLNDDDAQDTLSVLDLGALVTAQKSYASAIKIVDSAKLETSSINENSSNSTVIYGIKEVENALEVVRTALSDVYYVLEKTITSTALTQTELDALVSGVQTEQSAISTALTTLQTAYANWTNGTAYYVDLVQQYKDKVASAEDALNLAEAQLELKKAGPKNYDITAAEARVAKAEANLRYAQANYSDAIITAPVSGKIIEVEYQPGEQSSLATPVIKMIGQSNLEIEVDIPESDIAKVEEGQVVEITLDSFGDDVIFNGTVTFIDPAETLIQDVVYYQVKVQFDKDEISIKPGMTANVIIYTNKVENALRVPLRAVKQENGDKIVEVLEGKSVTKKNVTLGLRGDDFYEIKNGLEEGEQVITFIKE